MRVLLFDFCESLFFFQCECLDIEIIFTKTLHHEPFFGSDNSYFSGIKIVQQMAILMGCAVLPHLRSLVEIVETGLVDDQQKVILIKLLSVM